MVKGIHNVARKMEQQGYAIIIIGDRHHDEVHGIVGQLQKKPIVIDRADAVPHRRLQKLKKAAVVVQSTQNAENVLKIIDSVKAGCPRPAVLQYHLPADQNPPGGNKDHAPGK